MPSTFRMAICTQMSSLTDCRPHSVPRVCRRYLGETPSQSISASLFERFCSSLTGMPVAALTAAGLALAVALLVAGPLAVMASSLADRDTRPLEVLIYSVVITGLCVGMFKYILRLPIPIAPWLLGY